MACYLRTASSHAVVGLSAIRLHASAGNQPRWQMGACVCSESQVGGVSMLKPAIIAAMRLTDPPT